MAITLREPTLPDAPQIAELHVATWREAYSHLLPEGFFTEEHVQGRHLMWNRILENPRPDWKIRIAEHNAQIVGFGFAGPSYGAEGQDLPAIVNYSASMWRQSTTEPVWDRRCWMRP